MNCLNCNIRGITTPGRKPMIIDTIHRTQATVVCFQETKKETLTDSFLKSIVGNRNFSWNMLPSIGSAGGILMGVDLDLFDILSWEIRKFSIACQVNFRPKNLSLTFISVYGSPYEEGKEEFISELHSILMGTSGPMLIAGDFNLVRYQTDKSNGNVDQRWCDKFNSWIGI